MALGCFAGLWDGGMSGKTLGLLVGALATIVTGATFIIQVLSMSWDSASAVYGHSLGARGKRPQLREPTHSYLPTRKRWSG